MIAQEIFGRPYLTIFGIKATTIVWILIAIFLGLVFSMVMWPSLWRKIYHQEIKSNADKKNKATVDTEPKHSWIKSFRFIPWQLAVIIIIIAVAFFIAGSFLGFSTSYEKFINEDSSCVTAPCQSFDINCPTCECKLCPNDVRVTIPMPGG
jgi:uncharacterized membrane protein